MAKLYGPCLVAAVLFLGFSDTHTDEDAILLGFVLIASGVLGLIFPRYFATTGIVLGLVMFVTETLVHYGILHAPWPSAPGIPWAPLVALVPALLGAGAGAGIRRIAARTASV